MFVENLNYFCWKLELFHKKYNFVWRIYCYCTENDPFCTKIKHFFPLQWPKIDFSEQSILFSIQIWFLHGNIHNSFQKYSPNYPQIYLLLIQSSLISHSISSGAVKKLKGNKPTHRRVEGECRYKLRASNDLTQNSNYDHVKSWMRW